MVSTKAASGTCTYVIDLLSLELSSLLRGSCYRTFGLMLLLLQRSTRVEERLLVRWLGAALLFLLLCERESEGAEQFLLLECLLLGF